MPDSDESKREVRADTRDVRADARDDRAGARDTRADVRDVAAEDRDSRADTRDETSAARETVVEDKESRVLAILERVVRIFRIIIFMVIVLIILAVGNYLRSIVNEHTADDARDAASEAKIAAARVEKSVDEIRLITQNTLDDLQAAIERGAEAGGASAEAIKAIARIEHQLCGGKCPEVPEE